MRKKKVPWPVKISGEHFTIKAFEDSIKSSITNCTHMLITGGKDFTFLVGKTESITTKENVKNVINSLFTAICLLVFSCNTT